MLIIMAKGCGRFWRVWQNRVGDWRPILERRLVSLTTMSIPRMGSGKALLRATRFGISHRIASLYGPDCLNTIYNALL